ncbi:hypothetical protein ACFVTC_12030 [Streptomyces sp. NPDC057950]|uniref:hypothetical protein n=1 Tax=Streptomyces sp. NPDC057950 TaxID=3346288 RepID=UPI0036F0558A
MRESGRPLPGAVRSADSARVVPIAVPDAPVPSAPDALVPGALGTGRARISLLGPDAEAVECGTR